MVTDKVNWPFRKHSGVASNILKFMQDLCVCMCVCVCVGGWVYVCVPVCMYAGVHVCAPI